METVKKTLHILVVEDNPGDFLLVEEFLTEMFELPEIIQATRFSEAREQLNTSAVMFDAVLLDLTLPDKSGKELIDEMMKLTPDMPIIVLTGYTDIKFSMLSLSKGVSDYLLKDELSPELLKKSILYAIGRNASASSLLQSEKNYRVLFELSPEPMMLFELDTYRFLAVNQAAVNKYGYSKDEFLNMTLMDIKPQEELEESKSVIQNTEGLTHIKFDKNYRHITKSGKEILVEIHASTVEYNGMKARMALAHDVTINKKIELQLTESLKEKNILLSEIHHRVKNNLAVVSGMMQLQAYEENNPEVTARLNDSISRIHAMATIHELLYQSGSFSKLRFSDVLEKLVQNIHSVSGREKKIEVSVTKSDIQLNINQAIPASLILNEILSNVFKHAFKNRKTGKINIIIEEVNSEIIIKVEDNGVGISPQDKNIKSLGLQIVDILTQQLEGNQEVHNTGSGTAFELKFEKKDVQGSGSSL